MPLPGFESLARKVKRALETADFAFDTDVDVALPEIDIRASGEPFVRLGKQHRVAARAVSRR